MPQIINTNISSLTAQRNLNSSQSDQGTALQRLSSGLRINSAKDDAAGLAISTKFESQVSGLNVAIRNAGDGISLAQTAEGALGAMTENLQRVRELAVQSSNATNSDDDRVALQAEVEQLMAEVSRTADETNFNGRNLLDGSFSGTFQIGANAGQTVDVNIGELTAEKLGVGDATGVSAIGNSDAIQNGDLTINGVAIEPSEAGSDTSSVVGAGSSAIAKVATINEASDETGVKAVVNTNVASGAEMTAGAVSGTMLINDVSIDVATGGTNIQADRNSVISAINGKSDQTGVTAIDGGDAGGVILEAADGRNITVEFSSFTTGGVDAEDADVAAATGVNGGSFADPLDSTTDNRTTTYGGYTLISDDGSDITLEGGSGTGTGDISRAGLTAGVYSGAEAAVVSTVRETGISSTELSATFTTSAPTIAADTVINATNNSFEVSVNGEDFALVTLGSGFDAGSGVGEYDDAAQFAAQINNAITDATDVDTYAANAAFRDTVTNEPLFTASATDDGELVFTTTDIGEGANIVARTGAGSIAIPTDTVETTGAAPETVQSLTLDFKFDGSNVLGAGDVNLRFTTAGAVNQDLGITIAADTAFTAEEFVELANTELAADGVDATASVGDDGVSVVFTATGGLDDPIASIADNTSTVTATELQSNFQKLSNDSTVITDVDQFAQLIGVAGNDSIAMSVDGGVAVDLVLSDGTSDGSAGVSLAYETLTGRVYADDLTAAQDGASATQADDLATFLNGVMGSQAAGSGVTATAVGDQVVLSSDSTDGEVALSNAVAGADIMGTDNATNAVAVDATAATTADIGGASGTAITGAFTVDEEGYFLSGDPDPADDLVEPERQALQIVAGENDTFSIAIDGGTATEVTIGEGSYETMEELAAAVSAGLSGPATTTTAAAEAVVTGALDLNAEVAGSFDFATQDTASFDIALDGGVAQTINVATDYTGGGVNDAPTSLAAMLTDINTQLDTAFGANQIEATVDATSGFLTFTTVDTGAAASLEITNTDLDVDGDTNDSIAFVADVAATTGTDAGSSTAAGAEVTVSDDNSQLVFTSTSELATSEVDITNGTFAVEGGAVVGGTVTSLEEPNALDSGDLVLNGTSIGAASALSDTASDDTAETSSVAASGIATAAAINNATEQTGVTASVNATQVVGGDSSVTTSADVGSTGYVYINNVQSGSITLTGEEGNDRSSAIDAINAISGQTGVTAEDNGESITLTAADGRNVSVAVDNNAAANALVSLDSEGFGASIGLSSDFSQGIGEGDFAGSDSTYANTAGTTYSTVTLSAAGSIEVESGVNGADEVEALGLQLGTYGGGEDGTFLADLDISTFEGAQAAITAIDNALQTISSQRADLGALQNRFESTSSNLQITSENLSAANSRIRDADFASETAELSRTQVLQQAGISVLAQANQLPQQVLSLLG